MRALACGLCEFSIFSSFFGKVVWCVCGGFAGVRESVRRVLSDMAAAESVQLDKLTRRNGIKVISAERCSIEDCSIAVAQVVGYRSILSASRMNSAFVLFLDDVNKVNEIVASGIVLNDSYTPVMPLIQPAKKILLSNVPPFIKDEVIQRELVRHGKIVSQFKKITLNCKSAQLKHVVSFRRQVYMILNNENAELNLAIKFRIDDFDYVIYVTSETMKCFKCGQGGHLARVCPENVEHDAVQNNIEGEGQKDNVENGNQEKGGEVLENGEQTNQEETVNRSNEEEVGEGEIEKANDAAGPYVNVEVSGDIDMVEDDNLFKTPTLKRKTSGKSRGKKVRKEQVQEDQTKEKMVQETMADIEHSNSDDSVTGSECESVSSVDSVSQRRSGRSAYTLEKIKSFLQNTKGMKGVLVQDFFPDTEMFIEAARMAMKEIGLGGLTEQEVYRLKKLVQKVRSNRLNDEKEVF